MRERSVDTRKNPLPTVLKGLGMASLFLLPFACGFVEFLASTGDIIRREYHDHASKAMGGPNGPYVKDENFIEVLYNSAIHGTPIEVIAEGERVDKYPTLEGEAHFHKHPDNEEGIPVVAYGPYELTIEKV